MARVQRAHRGDQGDGVRELAECGARIGDRLAGVQEVDRSEDCGCWLFETMLRKNDHPCAELREQVRGFGVGSGFGKSSIANQRLVVGSIFSGLGESSRGRSLRGGQLRILVRAFLGGGASGVRRIE